MALSSGTRNLVQMACGWCLASTLGAAGIAHLDEIRSVLGLKLEAEDLVGRDAAALAPREPEVRTIIRYVDRPVEREDEPRPRPRQRAEPRRWGSVELRANASGHFETEVYINSGRARVLVDTGATLVAMTYEDARSAGVEVREGDFRYSTRTANGSARIARVTLDEVRLGDITVRNVEASVAEPGRLHVTLLGMSFLGRLRVEMQPGQLILEQ